MPIACTVADQKLRLRVDGLWKVCDYAGQQLQSWWDKNDFGAYYIFIIMNSILTLSNIRSSVELRLKLCVLILVGCVQHFIVKRTV